MERMQINNPKRPELITQCQRGQEYFPSLVRFPGSKQPSQEVCLCCERKWNTRTRLGMKHDGFTFLPVSSCFGASVTLVHLIDGNSQVLKNILKGKQWLISRGPCSRHWSQMVLQGKTLSQRGWFHIYFNPASPTRWHGDSPSLEVCGAWMV